MRRNLASLGGAQFGVVMHDIEEGFVDFSNVVEQRDALDRATLAFIESGRVADDESVGGNAPNVHAGLWIVGLDSVEQRFERGSGDTLNGSARAALANEQCPSGGQRDH